MYPYLKKLHFNKASFSYYSQLIDHCLSLKSLEFTKSIHAQLIKVGFNGHTYLGNRCLDLYSRFGNFDDVLEVFDEIPEKNCISWNICLKSLLKGNQLSNARKMFDEMPERDVVSWNSMISGYISCGYFDYALELFYKMQNDGVRPSGFTFSIILSSVSSACYGKQIHGAIVRQGGSLSNVAVGNCLIDLYGKLDYLDYAFGVFLTMEELDIISWNSLISGCLKSGYAELALNQFCLMRSSGYSPDEFTVSTVITACSNLRNLGKGKQIFAFCVKVGFLCNSILLSAAIDLFAKCNRLEDSVMLFGELDRCDSAICNSMISSYGRHGFGEDAMRLFVLSLREDFRPTEFTLSSVLSSNTVLPVECGSQVHSLAIKLGFQSDAVVASSLVEMYSKFGAVDSAMKIFVNMEIRDLISWNTIIMGLSHNGRLAQTLDMFNELLKNGLCPDQITLTGVLLACKYGGFVNEGMFIFSSMKEVYGVIPGDEHYVCIIDLLCRAGKLRKAIDVIKSMPYEPSHLIWESLLSACAIYGDLKLIEYVAERIMDLQPVSLLPYLLLVQAYETRGKWEGLVKVKKAMRQRGVVKKVTGCSWIGIRNHVYTFNAEQLQLHGGKEIYLLLRLLIWEMEDEGFFIFTA